MPIVYNISLMVDIKKDLVPQPDFSAIGRKFQTDEALTPEEKSAVFSVALAYADELIKARITSIAGRVGSEKDAISPYPAKSKKVKDYAEGIVLRRIVDLRDRAFKSGETEADSVHKFIGLRNTLSNKLSLDPADVSDEEFSVFIKELADSYLESHYNSEVQSELGFIRGMLPVVVANNLT